MEGPRSPPKPLEILSPREEEDRHGETAGGARSQEVGVSNWESRGCWKGRRDPNLLAPGIRFPPSQPQHFREMPQ